MADERNSGLSEVSIARSSNLNGLSTQIISLQGQSLSTKLDDMNFLLWKQQVFATIEGFGLEKFLIGSVPVPEKYVPGTSDEVVINPEYVTWRRQDQLITSWLLSSMTEGILVGVVGLTNSMEIWTTLEANFASQSRAKLMQLKFQLQTLRKGTTSMKDYLNKVKTCCDILASAGETITDDNQILHILTGLGPEYNPVMVSLTARTEPCSLREVKALLLTYESRLEIADLSTVSIEGSSPTANVAFPTQSGRSYGYQNNNRGRGNQYHVRGGGRHNNYRGRGGRFNNNYKPRCQICKVLGHTADRCHERHNPSFSPDNYNGTIVINLC